MLSVLIGIVAFAAANVVIAHKLSGISPLAVVPIYSLFVAMTTFGLGRAAQAMGYAVPLPGSNALLWLLVIGTLFVIGDLAYIGAYSMRGASMATITTCVALIPAIAAIIEKLCIGGALPSMRTMFGFCLAVFTIWVVAFDPANIPIKH